MRTGTGERGQESYEKGDHYNLYLTAKSGGKKTRKDDRPRASIAKWSRAELGTIGSMRKSAVVKLRSFAVTPVAFGRLAVRHEPVSRILVFGCRFLDFIVPKNDSKDNYKNVQVHLFLQSSTFANAL
jgi:hypothetical protein